MLTRKIITAGCLTIEAVYPRRERGDSDRARAAKAKASCEAQRRMNEIYSLQKFELLLAANYPTPGSGLVVTLTYDDKHLPRSRREAQRRFMYFLSKLRCEREAAGLPPPRVCYAPEALSSKSGRWHHHMVLDSTGDDLPMLRRCWIYGSDIEAEKLRVDEEKDHATLARYMTKELREAQEYDCKPGLHGWGCTRSCRRPEVETLPAESEREADPPEGAVVLIDERRQTEFSAWRVVKYRIGAQAFSRAPKAKRRR